MDANKHNKKEGMILSRLRQSGYNAYVVGGCVRDELLGLEVNDIDITTNALPDEIADVFKDNDLNFVGKQFGVTIVNGIEIATFRSEQYETMGKPIVRLESDFFKDASRRDFTINAMAKDASGKIIDFFNGRDDLKCRIIRAVGNPVDRINEDPIRILRGIYLASFLDFDIEIETKIAMMDQGVLLRNLPIQVIGKMFKKVIDRNCLSGFMTWLKKLDLVRFVFPDLEHMLGLQQNPKYHDSDVFEHTVRVIESIEDQCPSDEVMLLTGLFHDVSKGLEGIRSLNKEGEPSDINHESHGVKIAERILKHMPFSKKVTRSVLFLIEFHGLQLQKNAREKSVKKAIRKMAVSFKTKEELTEGVNRLFLFMNCDADGFAPNFKVKKKEINKSLETKFQEVMESTIFYRYELPITGKDVMKYGFKGEEIRTQLDNLVRENITSINMIEKRLTNQLKS